MYLDEGRGTRVERKSRRRGFVRPVPRRSSLIPRPSNAARPGVEPGTTRSKRGVMSVSPSGCVAAHFAECDAGNRRGSFRSVGPARSTKKRPGVTVTPGPCDRSQEIRSQRRSRTNQRTHTGRQPIHCLSRFPQRQLPFISDLAFQNGSILALAVNSPLFPTDAIRPDQVHAVLQEFQTFGQGCPIEARQVDLCLVLHCVDVQTSSISTVP